MTVVVTGSLRTPAAFGAALERYGRRSIAQQLRRQGEFAGQLAENIAARELGPRRAGNRRRTDGPSYHDSFKVEYTGVDEFSRGDMEVTVLNTAPHAGWIEEGTPAHPIRPGSRRGRLRWPSAPYASPGPPWAFVGKPGQSVNNPGFEGKKICKRAAVQAIIERLGGRNMGHAQIRIRVF